MSVKAFELYGEVTLKGASNVTSSLKTVSAQVDKTGRDLSTKLKGNMGGGFLGGLKGDVSTLSDLSQIIQGIPALGTIISTLAGPVKSFVDMGLAYNDTLEGARISMKNLIGDATKVEQHITLLQDKAKTTPFNFQGLVDVSQYIQGVGFSVEKVWPLIEGFGAALSAMGKGTTDNLEGVMMQIGQMHASGRANSADLRVISQYGVPIYQMVADASGISVAELRKRIEGGNVEADPFIDIFLEASKRKYPGQLEAMSKTRLGMQSNFIDAAQQRAGQATTGVHEGYKTFYGNTTTAMMGPQGDQFAKTVNSVGTGVADAINNAIVELIFGTGRQGGALETGAVQGVDVGIAVGKGVRGNAPGLLEGTVIGDAVKGVDTLEAKARSAMGNVIGGSVGALIEGKPALTKAGAEAGDAVIVGIKSKDGVDAHSDSVKAKEAGWNVRSGFVSGLLDPTINVHGAGAFVGMEGIDGLYAGGRGLPGMSRGQGRNYENFEALTRADPNFIKTLVAQSAKRNVNPDDMLNLIGIESRFDKSVVNKFGYGGLGQVGRNERKSLGLPVGDAEFKQMLDSHSASWQVENVLMPFLDMKLKQNPGVLKDGDISLSELYSMWGPGSATGNPEHIKMVRGGKRATAYKNNPLWDPDKDGIVREKDLGVAALNALGAGKFFSINGTPITDTNPMPVKLSGAFSGATGGAQGWRPFVPSVGSEAAHTRNIYTSKRASGQSYSAGMIDDPFPIIVEVRAAMEPLTQTFNELNMATTLARRPLIELTDEMKELSALQAMEDFIKQHNEKATKGFTEAEKAENARRLGLTSGAGAMQKSFNLANVSGDFQGGLQNLLAGLGHDNPLSLGKQFLFGLVQSIQSRIATDMSAMITGSLFGTSKKDGDPLSGGLLSKLFGSLFGGGRASGGDVSGGRFYMFGEHGPELGYIGAGASGHIYNNRETRGMIGSGGRGEERTIVAIGDRAIAEAVDAYMNTGRGKRARIIQGKHMRLLQSVSY